jgi:hypothetical protein
VISPSISSGGMAREAAPRGSGPGLPQPVGRRRRGANEILHAHDAGMEAFYGSVLDLALE